MIIIFSYSMISYIYWLLINRCFPHIVNLACQAVIGKITNISLATITSEDYDPDPEAGGTEDTEPQPRDVIAVLRNAIRAVCSSTMTNTV
jgi:hypothetical protein